MFCLVKIVDFFRCFDATKALLLEGGNKMKMKHLSEYRGMQWNRVKVNEKIRNIYRESLLAQLGNTWICIFVCMYINDRLSRPGAQGPRLSANR